MTTIELPPATANDLIDLWSLRSSQDGAIFAALLRQAGWPVTSLAATLGVSRQAVSKRLKAVDLDALSGPRDHPLPSVPTPPESFGTRRSRQSATLTEEDKAALLTLQAAAGPVSGSTSRDDPRRGHSVALTAMIDRLMREKGVTVPVIAPAINRSKAAIYARLARHGYRQPYPSRAHEAYQGGSTNEETS